MVHLNVEIYTFETTLTEAKIGLEPNDLMSANQLLFGSTLNTRLLGECEPVKRQILHMQLLTTKLRADNQATATLHSLQDATHQHPSRQFGCGFCM
jgi:hypothetical protein